jgi:hypothetical protein
MPCTTTQKTIGPTIIEISLRKPTEKTFRPMAKPGTATPKHDAQHQTGEDLNEERLAKWLPRGGRWYGLLHGVRLRLEAGPARPAEADCRSKDHAILVETGYWAVAEAVGSVVSGSLQGHSGAHPGRAADGNAAVLGDGEGTRRVNARPCLAARAMRLAGGSGRPASG